jgi:N-methylhydantoinase A/oxoprolinase/acetone carboxylase beta subunit
MKISLGIDSGGTFTDAVLIDQETGSVLSSSKVYTTHEDLSTGIKKSIGAVLQSATSNHPVYPADVDLVGLSTTLATNALVEGRRSPVCLILLGYQPSLVDRYDFRKDFVTPDLVYVEGGHDSEGNEQATLNEEAIKEAVSRRNEVQAFAVSSYFSTRNPAHELRAMEIIEQVAAAVGRRVSVTCGCQLTDGLDSVRRASTAALNASLTPLLSTLILKVSESLVGFGIVAPLMVVKGDGSLIRAELALSKPVETILSGPAASLIGAMHLSGRQSACIVDVGGTTTDIVMLKDGRPKLNRSGARVGRWRTMVETADISTLGLGGDSYIRFSAISRPKLESLEIGPTRVVPLCVIAQEYPAVVDEINEQLEISNRRREIEAGEFMIPNYDSHWEKNGCPLLETISKGPISRMKLFRNCKDVLGLRDELQRLERQQSILRAAFTPTDALHALGRLHIWNSNASVLGAELLAAKLEVDPEKLCQQVVRQVSVKIAREIVTKVLIEEGALVKWDNERGSAGLFHRAMGEETESELACMLRLKTPIVAVGAPVEEYLPEVASRLNTELIIPRHAEVANAVGAVVGSVVVRRCVLIRPIGCNSLYRAHLPTEVRDFHSLELGINYAKQTVPLHMLNLAKKSGASQVEIKLQQFESTAPSSYGASIHLETVLMFTAIGRPRPSMSMSC